MKPLIIFIFSMLAQSSNLFAQGAFAFDNYESGVVDAPVFDVSGIALYGTNYIASLYGGLTQDSLVEAVDGNLGGPLRVPFTYAPNGNHGYFSSPSFAYFRFMPAGTWVYLQVRAWDLRLGDSYEHVVAKGMGGYGASTIFSELTPGFQSPPKPLYALQSFSLVPEPATWVLLSAGLALMWARCKRRI